MSKHRFSARAERLLKALLTEPSISQAAKVSGLSDRQARRLMAAPAFVARFEEARKEAIGLCITKVQHEMSRSVSALISIRDNPKNAPSARVAAATKILDMGVMFAERQSDLKHKAELKEQLRLLHQQQEQALDARAALPSHGDEETGEKTLDELLDASDE
jgi:hypothetical protein